MVGLASALLQKHLVSVKMSLLSDTLEVMVRTLQMCPDTTTMTVEEMLNTLERHFQGHGNIALRKKAFSSSK